MIHFLIRRLAIGSLTLLLITFVIFALIRNMPGTPLTTDPAMMDPSRRIDPENLKRLERLYGLDKPWYEAYVVWVGNLARLDLGRSISRYNPVTTLIRERIGPTLVLSVTSLILAYLLSIPIGLWASAKSGTLAERTVSALLYMLYSLPSFVAALFLQILLAVQLGWLPLLGMTGDDYESMSAPGKAWDITLHSLMPVACFTYGSLAYYTRFIRSNMHEVIRQDYIRTALAKGVPRHRIIVHHAFRNTLIPLVTMIGLTLPGLLSGAIILERIFTWPGMGSLFFDAITERDYPTIMGLTLMFSILTLAGQLLADVLYAVVDPRVTYS
jgi:peptide/nickel transport system permease protein